MFNNEINKPISVLMVCLGNICRSPLAQGILEKNLEAMQENDWHVDSAGTGSWHIGEPPDQRSVNVARKYGLDISKQRARQINKNDFHQFDFMLAMDDANYRDLLQKSEQYNGTVKIFKITDLAGAQTRQSIVPDPYYDGKFEEVYALLDSIMGDVIASCKKLYVEHA